MIAERLTLPVPVLFFPEGTSTDGSSVLRFHSRLFEPAIRAGAPVTAAASSLRARTMAPKNATSAGSATTLFFLIFGRPWALPASPPRSALANRRSIPIAAPPPIRLARKSLPCATANSFSNNRFPLLISH